MRPLSGVAKATLLVEAIVIGSGALMPSSVANADNSLDNYGAYAINGTFAATSDGNFATTNFAFHNEDTVRSTWTITSRCITDVNCTGQVTSDQGWSAPIYTEAHVWYLQRDIPNWEPCPDGTSVSGHQTFKFYPANADGVTQIGSPYLEGTDKTLGPHWGCGRFDELTIEMPFRLDKLS